MKKLTRHAAHQATQMPFPTLRLQPLTNDMIQQEKKCFPPADLLNGKPEKIIKKQTKPKKPAYLH